MSDVITPKTPDALDVALGSMVRMRRRTMGLTQDMLAEHCGVSFQQIQKYENGANRISFSRLVQIATALSCRVSDLIGVLDDADVGAATDLNGHSRMALPGAQDLLEAYEALPAQTRAHLLGLARAAAA